MWTPGILGPAVECRRLTPPIRSLRLRHKGSIFPRVLRATWHCRNTGSVECGHLDEPGMVRWRHGRRPPTPPIRHPLLKKEGSVFLGILGGNGPSRNSGFVYIICRRLETWIRRRSLTAPICRPVPQHKGSVFQSLLRTNWHSRNGRSALVKFGHGSEDVTSAGLSRHQQAFYSYSIQGACFCVYLE